MRHLGRLAALGTICAVALWLTTAPASAVTLSVGGSAAGATVSVGGGPVAVGVTAPDSTAIALEAGPSGAKAAVDTPLTPPLEVALTTPQLARPLPIVSSDPEPTPAPMNTPSGAVTAPPKSAAPVIASPGGAATPSKTTPVAISTRRDVAVSTATGAINSVHHNATHPRSPNVTASIASSSDTGVLSALRSVDAQLMLWIALAALVVMMRLFAGSATSQAARAVTSQAARAG